MRKNGFQKWFRALAAGLAVALVVITQGACFDPQDGCLDIAATNFNAAADKNCCCRYPNLILSTNQLYDTLVYQQGVAYPDANNHLFRINSIVFYVSEFELFKNGDLFLTSDSLELDVFDPGVQDTVESLFKDDFVLIRRGPIDNEVGTFREDGAFERIRFRLGLPQNVANVVPALAPTSHALALKAENLYRNGDYIFMQTVVTRDTITGTLADTLNFTRSDLGDYFLESTGLFQHETGYNFKVTLNADWKKLFQGIIWTNHDVAAWKAQIVANLPSVFTVSQ